MRKKDREYLGIVIVSGIILTLFIYFYTSPPLNTSWDASSMCYITTLWGGSTTTIEPGETKSYSFTQETGDLRIPMEIKLQIISNPEVGYYAPVPLEISLNNEVVLESGITWSTVSAKTIAYETLLNCGVNTISIKNTGDTPYDIYQMTLRMQPKDWGTYCEGGVPLEVYYSNTCNAITLQEGCLAPDSSNYPYWCLGQTDNPPTTTQPCIGCDDGLNINMSILAGLVLAFIIGGIFLLTRKK